MSMHVHTHASLVLKLILIVILLPILILELVFTLMPMLSRINTRISQIVSPTCIYVCALVVLFDFTRSRGIPQTQHVIAEPCTARPANIQLPLVIQEEVPAQVLTWVESELGAELSRRLGWILPPSLFSSWLNAELSRQGYR